MKKIFILLFGLFFLSASYRLDAQSFSVQHDTVNFFYNNVTGGVQTVEDAINNLSTVVSDSIVIKWKVIATDFPADWVSLSGICDNNSCFPMTGLWPAGTLKTSNKYADGIGDFHLQVDLSSATSSGSYYVTVRMSNSAVPTDSASETYIVTKGNTSAVPTVVKSDEVILYPNPARNELNLVYDENADIKNIAVYNIIGKVMAVYKATDNSGANLNLENFPSGIYFARLTNSQGNLVCTRKFTKQ